MTFKQRRALVFKEAWRLLSHIGTCGLWHDVCVSSSFSVGVQLFIEVKVLVELTAAVESEGRLIH